MAKYRITSIPQYAPGGETNWPPDWMKRKKKKSDSVTDYRPTSDEIMVQGVDPQNIWSNINPTNFPTAEQFSTYDIGSQDYGRKRTGLEQYETLPIAFNQEYGLKTNPSTGKIETVPAGNYQDQYGRTRNVKANRFTNVDNQGRPLDCPSGSRPYNGVCLTNEEYKQVIDKEESDINYRDDVRIEETKKEKEDYEKAFALYIENNTKKGSKNNKLEPFKTFTQEQWEKKGLDNWYNNPDSEMISGNEDFYLDKKDLGDGKSEYKLYPREVIQGLMINYGVRPKDFEKVSGLDAKNLQEEFKDHIAYYDAYYEFQGKQLIDKYTKEGLSAEKVKQKLLKDGYVDEKKFNTLFKDVAEGFDYKNNGDKFFVGETDQKLYKTDKNNKVYEYNNDTWTLVKPTKEQEANFKNMSPKDRKIFSDQGTYMSGEKLMVNGNSATFYGASLNDKQQTSVLTDYKKDISDYNTYKQREEGNYLYSAYNDKLYNHVYGTDFGNLKKINPLEIPTTAERISGTNIDSPHIGYTQAYNKVVDELNAVTKNKKSTDSFEDLRKKKATILEKFVNLAGSGDTNRGKYNQPSWGLLPEYNYTGTFGPSTFQTKDITAYKDKDKLASQLTFAIDNEAQNYLYQAYENNILPDAYNAHTTNYKGTNLKEKYPTFQDFVQSPEGKSFLNTYVQSPDVGKTLFNNAYNFKEKNFITDQQNEELALGRKNLAKAGDWSNFTWENATSNYGLGALDLGVDALFRYYDQGFSLISQPWNTIDQWRQGKLQDRGIGIIGDSPTERDLKNMDEKYGPGTSSAYLEKLNKIGQNPFSQITNLFNPMYFAAGAGRGIGRKIVGDPDQSFVDIGENLLFAFMGTKGGSKLMNTKALSYLPKVIPRALKTSKLANVLKTNKVTSRIGTAATNYGTFGNGLNAYFLDHAFMPSTDSETGETVQGFGTEAFKNIYKGLTDKNGINMDMISPNLVNAYMAYSIGKHGLHNANYLSGNLLGKPALVPRLPIQDRISEGFQKFKRIPKIVKDPKSGYLKFEYEDFQFDPTIKNNNRKGENYHQKGGIVLPKAARGKGVKTRNERISERRTRRSEREIEKEVTRSLENLDFTNYVNATAPETMTLIDNLKNNNASGGNYVEPTVGEKPVLPAEFVPASNLNVKNDFGFSALGAEQVPAIPKAPWELQDLPGRQLKSLMSNGSIFKIVEPKTGLVNLDQALGKIGNESGGAEKLAFTKQGLADFLEQGLDQPLPEKMDFNQLRRITQEKIVPMETQIVEHGSAFGVGGLGYPSVSTKTYTSVLANNEKDIAKLNEDILKAQAEPEKVNMAEELKKQYPELDLNLKKMNIPEIGYSTINNNGNIQYVPTLAEAKKIQEATLNSFNRQLEEDKLRLDKTKKEMENLPLENKTLIISNKDQFGQSESGSHGNPPETLGHIHFLIDKETPDIATITQIQADPFQSQNYWKYNINKETKDIGKAIRSLKTELDPTFSTGQNLSEEEKIEINNKIEKLKEELEPIVIKNTPNYEQKVLLEASHQQRLLQEFVDYAAKRGDINKIRIPTLKTAAVVQQYKPITHEWIDAETKDIYDRSNTFEEAVANHLKLYPEEKSFLDNPEKMVYAQDHYSRYKQGKFKPTYSPKHMTVLKKYIKQAENVRKLFGQDTRPVADNKGNTWYEFDIPKSFKDLKGEIQAYEEGGSIQMNLTQDEINSYANGGWIVEDLDTYQGGGGGKGRARREARRASKITIKQDISKKLADLTFTNHLNEFAPEQMSLITYLKNNNLISKTLPEGDLVTYPNLLNLATKKGIQDALTFSRSTAGTDFGISSSGTKTELAPRDSDAYKLFGIENDDVGKALYGATHVPFMRYGQRTGLTNLPYKIEEIKVYKFGEGASDYVVANNLEQAQEAYKKEYGTDLESSAFTPSTIQQATNDSFDALYTYANNTGIPRSVKKGIFSDEYGKFTSILRYPFDYSGSAKDMLSRFTDLEGSTFANAENLRRTGGREFPLPGSIGAYTFTDKSTLKNSFLAPIFSFSETPVIGRPGQKLFDPVAVYHKPELEQIDKEIEFVHTLFKDKKYDEAINFLNDKIKAGQFGSIESNIQSIKDNPKFPKFKFDYVSDKNMGDYLHMLDIINPKTGLIDTGLKGKELEDLVNSVRQSYDNYMYFGPRENAGYKTDNVEKIPYSPFRFKFKDGGELPKARFGKEKKTGKLFRKNNKEYFPGKYKFPDIEDWVVPTSNPNATKTYWDMWNKLIQKKLMENYVPIVPKLDERTRDLLSYPEFDYFTGDSSPGLSTPGDLQRNLGDINFKVFSDNWHATEELKNSMDPPQFVPTAEDFFTKTEFTDNMRKQMEYDIARMNFENENPEPPTEAIFRRLAGDTSRDELFSMLYPNVGLPNFRSKILSPKQQSHLEKFIGNSNPSVYQRGRLNPTTLESITTGNAYGKFDTLPESYKQLLETSKGNDFLKTGPAKVVVAEMRGLLGLSLEQVLNASPEQLEILRKKIVIKMGKQDLERWERDIKIPFTGVNAWGKITNEPGYKNKFGGVSMKLSKDEINKYVNGGYIVTEE